MKKLTLTLILGLLLTACSPKQTEEVTTEPINPPPAQVEETVNEPTSVQPDAEGVIQMEYESRTIRFRIPPVTAEATESPALLFDNDQTNTRNIMVETGGTVLEIGKDFFGPYQTMREYKPENISFKCDGTPILDMNEGKVATARCETNGIDYLEQFECTPGSVNVVVTGGEVVLFWSKIYLKKIGEDIYVFSGRLPAQQGVEYFDPYANNPDPELNGTIGLYCTEEELNKIIAKSDDYNSKANTELIKEWDELVESFQVIENP